MGLASRAAAASAADTAVTQALEQYTQAWESRNPFSLLALSPPDSAVFDSLLDDERFDQLAEVSVHLADIRITGDGKTGAYVAQFTKIHEELFSVGTVSRGMSRIELTLQSDGDTAWITGRRMLGPPPGARGDKRFLSSNPLTWEQWPVEGERTFYRAYRHIVSGEFSEGRRLLQPLAESGSTALEGLELSLGNHLFIAQIHYFLALCHHRLGGGDAAHAAATRATRANPTMALAHNLLGEIAAARGNVDAALRHWRKSLLAAPAQTEVQQRVSFFGAAVRHYPPGPTREQFVRTGDLPPAEAIEVLTELLEFDRRNGETRRRLAAVHLLTYDPESAERVLLENEYVHPGDLETQYLLGRVYLALSRYEDALTYFIKVWSRQPGYRDTLVYLSDLNANHNRYRNAISYLKEALELAPGDPLILYKLGVYSMRLGHRFDAASHFRLARRSRPPVTIRRDLHHRMNEL